MQVVVENLGSLARKMKVIVPTERIDQEMNKQIKEYAKKIDLKGFRKGKIPVSVIKMHYGQAIRQDVADDISRETFKEAVQQEHIHPASAPKIVITQLKEGQALEYEANFEVYPEITLASLEGVSIEKPVVEITDQDIAEVIEGLRKQNVNWQEVSRPSQKGDLVVIDFEGKLDGTPFKGGSAKGFSLELGSNKMIPGFEDSLLGVTPDQTTEINIVFPKEYPVPELAGKPVEFSVIVQKVKEAELPELNDAFAQSLGVSEGTVAGLHAEVRVNVEREIDRRVREIIKGQIVNKLLELNKIEIPQTLLDSEVKRLQKHMQQQLAERSGGQQNALDLELPSENFVEQARKNVTLGLLLSQWVQDHDIKLDSSRVTERIKHIAAGYHNPQEIINWYRDHRDILSEIEGQILEEQAMDKLLEEIQVIEKPIKYAEIMHPSVE
jgi:trigger factor